MSRYNDSSAVQYERFAVDQTRGDQQGLEVLENKRAGRVRRAVLPYGKYAVMLACAFAVLLGVVASYMRLATVNLENAKLRQQITKLESEENALNAKKEQLYNLAYVEDYAQNQLGMVKMDKSQINYVEMDTGDRMVLAAAAPAPTAQQSAGLLDRLARTFSAVLEYLN